MLTAIEIEVLHEDLGSITLNQVLMETSSQWLGCEIINFLPMGRSTKSGVDYLVEVVGLRGDREPGKPWFIVTGTLPVHSDCCGKLYWDYSQKESQYYKEYWDETQNFYLEILVGVDGYTRYQSSEWAVDDRPEADTLVKLIMDVMAQRAVLNRTFAVHPDDDEYVPIGRLSV